MNRTCVECGGRLPVPSRRDARYCGSACRQRAYRARARSGIPEEMKCRPRWVRYSRSKVPLTLFGGAASVTDPRTWTTYEKASCSTVGAGVGIVLGDGLGCIDLDDAIGADGRLESWAQDVLNEWRDEALFVEISMSGRGIHIFVPLPEQGGRKIRDGARKIEIYSRDRYIAVTGNEYRSR